MLHVDLQHCPCGQDTHAFNNSDDTEMYDFYTMNSDSPLSLERAQVIEHLPHVQVRTLQYALLDNLS